MANLQHEPLNVDEIFSEDLKAWANLVSERAPAAKGANPADAFFASTGLRDTYSVPWNDHICLIDLEAFPNGPVEGLSYGKATPLIVREGNVYQFLLSEDGEKLAIVSAFTLDALKTGALTPEDIWPPEDPEGTVVFAIATGIAVGALKCAKNPTCRGAVVKGAKWVVSAVAGGAAWDGIKRLFD